MAGDILAAVGIELACNECGARYTVTLKQVELSQEMLCESCLARGETECEPLFDASLVDSGLIHQLTDVWSRLDERARAAGGELRVVAPTAS